jgi:aldehyde:ferredoxin oxidoreductase
MPDGYNDRILHVDLTKGAFKMEPDNVLASMTDLTTGAAISGQNRINANTKSPNPVYLWFEDGEFELREAAHLFGIKMGEVDEIHKEEPGDKKLRFTAWTRR